MTLDLVLQQVDLALQEGRQADALAILEGVVADETARIRLELLAEVEENKQDMIEGEPVEDEWIRVGLLRAALDRFCPEP